MKRSINSTLSKIFSYRSNVEATAEFVTTLYALDALTKFKGLELDEFCRKLFSDPRLPESIRFIYRDANKFCNLSSIKFQDKNSELTWFNHLFNFNKDTINEFIKCKDKVEIAILRSDSKSASVTLDKINKIAGFSFWEVEMRSNICRYIHNESNSKYINNLRSSSDSIVVDFFLQQLLFKHQSKRFSTFSKNLVSIIDEMRDSPGEIVASNYADFYSSYFLPLEFDKRISIDDRRLWPCTNLSCIDQYLVFKRYILDKTLHGSPLNNRELSVTESLSKVINDRDLNSILLLNNNIEVDYNHDIIECINKYTQGKYPTTNEIISSLIEKSPSYMSLIEVLARSYIYENKHDESILVKKLASDFSSILMCKKDSRTKLIEIENFATSFSHSSICSSILFHLYGLVRNNDYKHKVSKLSSRILMGYATPYMRDEHADFQYSEKIQVPDYRKIKYRNIENFTNDQIEAHFQEYDRTAIIKSDYIKDRSDYLINNGYLLECASFVVDQYIDNNLTYQFLPISELIKLIEEEGISETTIDIPILYTIYSKNISKDKDEDKTEIYEDYISQFDTHLPSEIFYDAKALNAKSSYFLKNVCVTSNLDTSVEFDSTEDIKKERIAILEVLKLSKFNDELVNSERENILDEISFDELRAKFDSSKIFVDVEVIKNEKLDRYSFLYQLYQDAQINDVNLGADDGYTIIEDTHESKAVVPSSNVTDVLAQIYREIVNDFVLDENFGLDKYLSADIRHGIFVSQIRSGIEKFNIITDIDERGSYRNNTIIEEKYPLLVDDLKNKLIDDISIFSKEFDDIINAANNMFTVVTDTYDNSEGLFDFSAHLERINKLKSIIDSTSNFDNFFDSLIEFMWAITITSLERVKTNINEKLKSNLLSCVDRFETTIINHKQNVPLKEIIDSIAHMKVSIVEEMERVTSWLNIAEMNENNIYSVKSVVYACTKTFETIFSQNHIDLNVNNSHDHDVLLTYKEAKPLMTSIITALDNAITHGGGVVSLSINPIKDYTKIIISNNLHYSQVNDVDKLRILVKQKISDDNPQLSRIEGGTGLYKIYNLLKISSNKFSLNVEITEGNLFNVCIGIMK